MKFNEIIVVSQNTINLRNRQKFQFNFAYRVLKPYCYCILSKRKQDQSDV